MSTSTMVVERQRVSARARFSDYVELSKPRIALLVLVAVGVSYCVARWGQPDPWVLCHLLAGTLLVASSASALNQWLERDRDAMMPRTADRPLPAGRLGSLETTLAAAFSLLAGLAYLWGLVGVWPAIWALFTWMVYVWIYTPLKYCTSANTAVGAIAGAAPVLIGWTAGSPLDLRAGSLFLVLFLWQFPHFMAIAWIYRHQYRRAGMQMLPVVDPTGRRAGMQAVFAALGLIPVSIVPVLTSAGMGGWLYALAALALGIGQLGWAAAFLVRRDDRTARALLRASLLYLPALLLLLTMVPWV